MANSIAEQIVQNVITTLRGVNRGSGASVTLHLEDQDNDSEERRDGLCVVIPEDPQPLESPLGWKQWDMTMNVVVFLSRSETSQNTLRTRLANAMGDIHKALKVDAKRGGLAIHTYIEPPTTTIDGEFDRLIARPRVTFRHLIDNPFSQG